MARLLDGLVKGIASLMPQDDPDVQRFTGQNELRELTDQENELFIELGKKIYADGGCEAYPELAARLEAIAASRAEINRRIEQAQAEKEARERAEAEAAARAEAEEGRVCPECGTLNPDGTKFCRECGAKFAVETKKFCTGCGALIKPGMRFCGECGASVEQ